MLRLLLFAVLHLRSWSRAELFTAITDMEPLIDAQERIMDNLDLYIEREEMRLHTLKRFLDTFKQEHENALEDIPNYLGNPINAFTIIKRLTVDLRLIEIIVRNATVHMMTPADRDVMLPTSEDMQGAVAALTRLVDTYQLHARDLSEGLLNGVRYSKPMSASDCFEVGRALYNDGDYSNALQWMSEASRKYAEEDDFHTFTNIDIMEYIAFSYYKLGNLESALEWTHKILDEDPKHETANLNLFYFVKDLEQGTPNKNEQIEYAERHRQLEDWPEPQFGKWRYNYEREQKMYESLCRGEVELSPAVSKDLKCWYMSDHHPFLKYAPIKVEQSYIKPDIFIFHDVISDDEIEALKEMAKPKFQRAKVRQSETGEMEIASYRISKSAWLAEAAGTEGAVEAAAARVSRRVADLTGLALASAEELQVVNYGIGGHYDAHFDFTRDDEVKYYTASRGNRIATVLFYMSDVAQGGATVFPELGLSLPPQKGAAAFWLNLHRSGAGDMATRHAACPVLRGSKWVCNKWIHEGGQEFIRPCDLDNQPEAIIRRLPRPVLKTPR